MALSVHDRWSRPGAADTKSRRYHPTHPRLVTQWPEFGNGGDDGTKIRRSRLTSRRCTCCSRLYFRPLLVPRIAGGESSRFTTIVVPCRGTGRLCGPGLGILRGRIARYAEISRKYREVRRHSCRPVGARAAVLGLRSEIFRVVGVPADRRHADSHRAADGHRRAMPIATILTNGGPPEASYAGAGPSRARDVKPTAPKWRHHLHLTSPSYRASQISTNRG